MNKAEQFARKAHEGQYRGDGVTSYIVHPEKVASYFNSDSIEHQVAWLHDVLEDCNVSYHQLEDEFGKQIADIVYLLTDKDNSDYMQLIKANNVATKVKIADMLANLSDEPTKKQVKRYSERLSFLLNDYLKA